MLEFQKVTKQYQKDQPALRDVSFSLNRGEMAFLTGHSGAGKSTLLRLITLTEKPSSGDVLIAGQVINHIPSRRIPYLRRRIGMIFQDHRLLMHRTVFDNVALPLVMSGYSDLEIKRRVRAALDKVGLLKMEKVYPERLSGGEQQRVGIARAVVNRPPLLVADEPTGNLDPELSLEIMRLFEAFNRVGVTVLIASHELSMIARLRHRTLILKDGELVSKPVVEVPVRESLTPEKG